MKLSLLSREAWTMESSLSSSAATSNGVKKDGSGAQPYQQPPKYSFLFVLGMSFLMIHFLGGGGQQTGNNSNGGVVSVANAAAVDVPDDNRVRLEGEEAVYFEDCQIKKTVSGYSGTGFIDYKRKGGFVEWDIDVYNAGYHTFTLGFAAHNNRPVDVIVDNDFDNPIGEFKCNGSGSWHIWKEETISNVYLKEGIHTIRIEAVRSTGPNLDYLDIHGPPASGGGGTTPSPPDDTPAPTPAPVRVTTPAPVASSNPREGDRKTPQHFEPKDFTTVLNPNSRLELGDCKKSPNGQFEVCFNRSGNLVLKRGTTTIWDAGVNGGYRCYLQSDGNLIIRTSTNKKLWNSSTSLNHGSKLIIDDGGHLSIIKNTNPIWLRGIPRGTYNSNPPPSKSLEYPLRGIFYYHWYPETWTVRGKPIKFVPRLGKYSNFDTNVVENHIKQLDYAHVDFGVISWWGEYDKHDIARIGLLMDKTIELSSGIKWTIYHEDERYEDATVGHIKDELNYLKYWLAWHSAWAHM